MVHQSHQASKKAKEFLDKAKKKWKNLLRKSDRR